MFNIFFWVAVVIAFGLRIFDGKIISIALGLCVGIILSELWKFAVWYFR